MVSAQGNKYLNLSPAWRTGELENAARSERMEKMENLAPVCYRLQVTTNQQLVTGNLEPFTDLP